MTRCCNRMKQSLNMQHDFRHYSICKQNVEVKLSANWKRNFSSSNWIKTKTVFFSTEIHLGQDVKMFFSACINKIWVSSHQAASQKTMYHQCNMDHAGIMQWNGHEHWTNWTSHRGAFINVIRSLWDEVRVGDRHIQTNALHTSL